jgi:RHS repeat-associated protein
LRRNASDWSALGSPFAGSHETERGYTGHEHFDTVGLIHMNGRVQDPTLGRFISADPLIQAPFNTQSHNRYSYVWNNPTSYIDPSGFQRICIRAFIGRVCGGAGDGLDAVDHGGIIHTGLSDEEWAEMQRIFDQMDADRDAFESCCGHGPNGYVNYSGMGSPSGVTDGSTAGPGTPDVDLADLDDLISDSDAGVNVVIVSTAEAAALQRGGQFRLDENRIRSLRYYGNQYDLANVVRSAKLEQLRVYRLAQAAGAAGNALTVASVAVNYAQWSSGDLSNERFAFRMGGTGAVVVVAVVGTGGTAALVGLGFYGAEEGFDAANRAISVLAEGVVMLQNYLESKARSAIRFR